MGWTRKARLPAQASLCLVVAFFLGPTGAGRAQTSSTTKPTNNSGTAVLPAPPRTTARATIAPNKTHLSGVGRGGIRSTTTVNKNAGNRAAYVEALHRYHHERHNAGWWKQHFTTIVFNGGGYYYWDGGYWFPAWGYDPTYEYYEYDGPIYTYGNLLPDQVILNVQQALTDLGYYSGPLNGSLSGATRAAIATYQQDAGLDATGAIDAATVSALGLN